MKRKLKRSFKRLSIFVLCFILIFSIFVVNVSAVETSYNTLWTCDSIVDFLTFRSAMFIETDENVYINGSSDVAQDALGSFLNSPFYRVYNSNYAESLRYHNYFSTNFVNLPSVSESQKYILTLPITFVALSGSNNFLPNNYSTMDFYFTTNNIKKVSMTQQSYNGYSSDGYLVRDYVFTCTVTSAELSSFDGFNMDIILSGTSVRKPRVVFGVSKDKQITLTTDEKMYTKPDTSNVDSYYESEDQLRNETDGGMVEAGNIIDSLSNFETSTVFTAMASMSQFFNRLTNCNPIFAYIFTFAIILGLIGFILGLTSLIFKVVDKSK